MKPKKIQYAVVYATDGSTREITPKNGRRFEYEELRAAIGGGFLESVLPADKRCRQMYADEEGLLKRLPPNPHTPQICDMRVYALNGYSPDWRVHGPIVAVLTRVHC